MAYIHVPTMRYPLRERHIRAENPNTSFPSEFRPPDDYEEVRSVEPPAYDAMTQNLTELAPVLVDGVWTQVWQVSPATEEEIAQRLADQLAGLKASRAAAYKEEADPLFFKAHRGEATMEEWMAKIEEIRARFPYPSEAV